MNLSSLMFPLLLVLLAVPLFLSARKQKRAVAEQQQLQNSLEPGTRVMTTSGLHATVVSTEDDATIDLEIAPGVVTTWVRAAVRERIVTDVEETVVEEEVVEPVVADAAPEHVATEQVTAPEHEAAAELEHDKTKS
ncbi:preprotein translocase subunit YajC [Solihabitans fulvus]|uniref:Preprotein translocase subunit YajC n=1 Tax=Solihabitans fulvus TaxID=1892852 RepID=A0A5B2XFU4_9PSEU|nr:preprotein translocase subunit YajC [Solihabitans fulvus]KAA2261915.1 preprotein translocase subunit YajC [Solihabitans fulvus]